MRFLRPTADRLLALATFSLLGAAPSLAQIDISREVTRGVPRQLLITRSDDQLASLILSGARNYTTYSFQYGRGMDQARIRRWSGLLLLPREAELGKLGPINAESKDVWFTHADGTLSKVVVDQRGTAVGVISLLGPAMWVNIDIDRDGIVDFHRAISRDGHEFVAALDGRGGEFLERWRLGENRLCTPDRSKAPAVMGDKPDRTKDPMFSRAGTIPMCGETGPASGPLAGILRDRATPAPDPMSRICAGRSTRPSLGGVRTDLGPGGSSTDAARVAGSAGAPTPRESYERMAESAARLWGDMVRERMLILLLKPPKDEKDPGPRDATLESESSDRSSPTIGADGVRGGSGEQSLNEMCAARARADRRWHVIDIAEAESRKTGAGDTNCDDPVTDPAAAGAEKTMPKCGPARDNRSVSEQLLEGIGAYRERQCSRYERPGADGTCRGGRTITGGRGQVWYGFGSLIGLVPCDGIACDPRSESR